MILERCKHCGGLTNRLRQELYDRKRKKHEWQKLGRYCKFCKILFYKPNLKVEMDVRHRYP